jgi:hypothetical protein
MPSFFQGIIGNAEESAAPLLNIEQAFKAVL